MEARHPARNSLMLAGLGVLVSSTALAEVNVKLYERPIEEVRKTPQRPPIEDDRAGATAIPHKLEGVSDFWVLPHIKIDSTSNSGETTLLAVRNEDSSATNTVKIEVYEADSASNPIVFTNALLPWEVWTLNLRQQIGDAIPPDAGGIIRGWAAILALGPVTADYFQIDPGNDFAAGGAPIDVSAGEFCFNLKVRFLVGGAFTGGTQLTFMLALPAGGDANTDPPSVIGDVFREDGTYLNSFDIYTDNYSFQMDAAELARGANFGAMNLSVKSSGGGFAVGEHKADGRYSVSLKSYCLDNVNPKAGHSEPPTQ